MEAEKTLELNPSDTRWSNIASFISKSESEQVSHLSPVSHTLDSTTFKQCTSFHSIFLGKIIHLSNYVLKISLDRIFFCIERNHRIVFNKSPILTILFRHIFSLKTITASLVLIMGNYFVLSVDSTLIEFPAIFYSNKIK